MPDPIKPNCEYIFSSSSFWFERTFGGLTDFYRLDNRAGSGGAYMDSSDYKRFARAVAEDAGLKVVEGECSKSQQETKGANGQRRLSNLTDQAQLVFRHMQRAGSISARDAMNDHGITSATLSRRICDIEEEGFVVDRERRTHPITGKLYTRYVLVV